MPEQTYTLFDLNEQIKRVVALNFTSALWVSAEITQLSGKRGHVYLQLVEKEEEGEGVIAQAAAMIWQRDYRRLRKQLGVAFERVLQSGHKVLIQVEVNFDERYGMTLMVKDLDPGYTLGQLQLAKHRILEQLKNESLLDKNRKITMPLVLQRIAVLSSPSAAGYSDFQSQLKNNAYAYDFDTELFPIAVQGRSVEKEFLAQMNHIVKKKSAFDCVVVIRGGGAKLDLAGFDNLEIGRSIANCPLPVLTGIGHEIDQTIADVVAHTHLKTPTAVADFLLLKNAQFENHLMELARAIQNLSLRQLKTASLRLSKLESDFLHISRQVLNHQENRIQVFKNEISYLLKRNLSDSKKELDHLANLVRVLSLEATLKRGFTLTIKDGNTVKSVDQLEKGDTILTKFYNGEKRSIIE